MVLDISLRTFPFVNSTSDGGLISTTSHLFVSFFPVGLFISVGFSGNNYSLYELKRLRTVSLLNANSVLVPSFSTSTLFGGSVLNLFSNVDWTIQTGTSGMTLQSI